MSSAGNNQEDDSGETGDIFDLIELLNPYNSLTDEQKRIFYPGRLEREHTDILQRKMDALSPRIKAVLAAWEKLQSAIRSVGAARVEKLSTRAGEMETARAEFDNLLTADLKEFLDGMDLSPEGVLCPASRRE